MWETQRRGDCGRSTWAHILFLVHKPEKAVLLLQMSFPSSLDDGLNWTSQGAVSRNQIKANFVLECKWEYAHYESQVTI